MLKRLTKTYIAALFVSLLFLFAFHLHASPPQPLAQQESPIQAELGIYVMEIYNLDFSRDSFNAVFWVWWEYSDDDFKPYDSIELVNALNEKVEHKYFKKMGKSYRAEAKLIARVSKDWDFINFPFGKQTLEISLEDAHLPYSALKLSADKISSGIGKKRIEGWHITDFRIQSKITALETNFGRSSQDPETKFSNITAYIDIERDSSPLLMKYFIGFFVAIFLCIIMYFIGLQDLTTRMAIVIAAVFSAIGNKYILDNVLPDESELTFSDKVQLLTFGAILFSASSSTLTDYLARKISKTSAKTLNAILGIATVLAIIFFLTLFIDQAINAPQSN